MMKKFLQIGAVLLISGLALMGIGAANHGLQSVAIVGGSPTVVNSVTHTKNVRPFSAITAEVADLDVVVKTGAHYQVKVEADNHTVVHSQVKNGVLQITQKGAPAFGVMLSMNQAARITVTLPQSQKLTTARLYTEEGELTYAAPQTDRLRLTSANGDVTMHDAAAAHTTISTNSGEVTLSRTTLASPQITAQDGDINVAHGTITAAKFILTSGDFNMTKTALHGETTVSNIHGDNAVHNADRRLGYRLQSGTGDNTLFSHAATERSVKTNWTRADRLQLISHDGDNSVD